MTGPLPLLVDPQLGGAEVNSPLEREEPVMKGERRHGPGGSVQPCLEGDGTLRSATSGTDDQTVSELRQILFRGKHAGHSVTNEANINSISSSSCSLSRTCSL